MSTQRFAVSLQPSSSSMITDGKVELMLRLESQDGSVLKKLVIEAPGELEAQLPTGTSWHMSGHATNYWLAERSFTASAGEATHDLTLLPAGYVELGVSVEDTARLNDVAIRIKPTGNLQRTYHQSCHVASSNQVKCLAPEGAHDIRLTADGYVPHYWWNVAVPWKSARRLGTIRLKKGASLAGWIDPPKRDFDFSAVELVLKPSAAGSLPPETKRRIGQSQSKAAVNEHGFFQFSGVRPGQYELVADHEEFVATRMRVTLDVAEILELEPISLSQGAVLNLDIRQRTDPFGRPWEVTLGYRGGEKGYLEQMTSGTPAELDGTLQITGLPAGNFLLTIKDSRGGRWHSENLRLFDGDNYHPAEIRIERLEATILHRDEPLDGALVEIQEHQGNSRQYFRSREGKVYAFLEKDKLWNFDVEHEGLGVAASFRKIEVPSVQKEDSHAKIDLTVPETRIYGEVVDPYGSPVPEALHFDLQINDEAHLQRIIRGGSFDLSGIPEGTLLLQVSRDEPGGRTTAQSRRLELQIEEGVPQGPLTIQLGNTHSVSGLVISPAGDGVPGAQVVILPENSGGHSLTASVPATTTDFEGVFEIDLPREVRDVQLTVYPPGYASTQRRVRVDPDTPRTVIIPVDGIGGTVNIRYGVIPESKDGTPIGMTTQTVFRSPFAHVPLYLMRWAKISRSAEGLLHEIQIPMVAPGPVEVCFGPQAVTLLQTAGPVPVGLQSYCVTGDLPPHGELTLALGERLITKALETQTSF